MDRLPNTKRSEAQAARQADPCVRARVQRGGLFCQQLHDSGATRRTAPEQRTEQNLVPSRKRVLPQGWLSWVQKALSRPQGQVNQMVYSSKSYGLVE